MLGTTLSDIRAHIESLATGTGTYHLRCARSGERPVPCTGLRFESRADARAAARATEQYRKALRRYDPQLPYHDIIVSQTAHAAETPARRDPTEAIDAGQPSRSARPAVPGGGDEALVEFCHRVAGAVLEALSDAGFDEVESAVMETYLRLAETVPTRNALCLRLLESIATTFAERLPPEDQRRLLSEAASRLPSKAVADPAQAVDSSLDTLLERGLIGGYTHADQGSQAEGATTTVVRVSEYALSATGDRLPVLPLVLELYRTKCGHPSTSDLTALDGGWEIEITLTERPDGGGLANAPIGPDGPTGDR